MTDVPDVYLRCQAPLRYLFSFFAMFRQDSHTAIPCSAARESGKTFCVGFESWRRMLFMTHHRPFNPLPPVLSFLEFIEVTNARQVERGVF